MDVGRLGFWFMPSKHFDSVIEKTTDGADLNGQHAARVQNDLSLVMGF